MRKLLVTAIAAALASLPVGAGAQPREEPAPLFAGGGTNLSNGVFFPGTATYDGNDFVGVPLQVRKGQDVRLVNADAAALTNAHTMISWRKDKKGRPLFHSGYVRGPATAVVKTSHLKPGLYPFYCDVHFGMYGLLEVKKI